MVGSVINSNLVTISIKDAQVFDGPGPYPTTPQDFSALPNVELSNVAPRVPFMVQTAVTYNDIALVPFNFLNGMTLYGRSIMRHE
jgi:hypothetical protein